MSRDCQRVDAFFDGELGDAEAESFLVHLPDCRECQARVTQLEQLRAAGAAYFKRHPETSVVASGVRWRAWGAGLGLAACIAAALGVWTLANRRGSQHSSAELAKAVARMRPGLERSAYGPLAAYRQISGGQLGNSKGLPEHTQDDWRAHEDLIQDLRKKNDLLGVSSLYLEYGQSGLALEILKGLPRTPAVDAQLGLARLLECKKEAKKNASNLESNLEDCEKALADFDRVLEREPNHPQALWNRALVLDLLELKFTAAKTFDQVAALGEKGWSEEARDKAKEIRDKLQESFNHWDAAQQRGRNLVEGSSVDPEKFGDDPPINRVYFYDAVRTATSVAQLNHLGAVAARLDAQVTSGNLVAYVDEVRRQLPQRVPFARQYAKLSSNHLSPEETQRFLAQLERQPAFPDLLVGALVKAGPRGGEARAHFQALRRAADATHQPWFQLLAMQEEASVAAEAGNQPRAAALMEEAKERCERRTELQYRCIVVALELGKAYAGMGRMGDAWRVAQQGLVRAHALGVWPRESEFIQVLGQMARLRFRDSLARALVEESVLRSADKPDSPHVNKAVDRRGHEQLAIMELFRLHFERARRELDLAAATGVPLTLDGAFALADLERARGDARDADLLARALTTPGAVVSEAQQAFAQATRGRFTVARPGGQQEGRRLLAGAIASAEVILQRHPEDSLARRARSYSYTSLILEDGQVGDFGHALQRFAEEARIPVPERCALGVVEDLDRTLVVVRDVDGRIDGRYEEHRSARLGTDLTGFVPDALAASLARCPKVEVLAKAHLRGLPGLLPPTIAWSYHLRTGEPPSRSPRMDERRVVVANFDLVGAEKPVPWDVDRERKEGTSLPSDSGATPDRVMWELQRSTELLVYSHGVSTRENSASEILLAGAEGQNRLTSFEILYDDQHRRRERLPGAPVVMLVICSGIRVGPSLSEVVSLPEALVEVGARVVITSTEEIPDREAQTFFVGVRNRIRSGVDAAIALRDERMEWHRGGMAKGWIDSIVVVE